MSSLGSDKTVLVVGGCGALGRALVATAKAEGLLTASIDFRANPEAKYNVLLATGDSSTRVIAALPSDIAVCAVYCVAGGFVMDSAHSPVFEAHLGRMLAANVASVGLALALAAHYRPGLFMAVGAAPALRPAPTLLAYGTSKAAAVYLVRSAEMAGTRRIILCPEILDTEENRRTMERNGDTWTGLDVLAVFMLHPTEEGPVVAVRTRGGQTTFATVATE